MRLKSLYLKEFKNLVDFKINFDAIKRAPTPSISVAKAVGNGPYADAIALGPEVFAENELGLAAFLNAVSSMEIQADETLTQVTIPDFLFDVPGDSTPVW